MHLICVMGMIKKTLVSPHFTIQTSLGNDRQGEFQAFRLLLFQLCQTYTDIREQLLAGFCMRFQNGDDFYESS